MDSVSIAFDLMRLELEAEVDALNAEGAKLFHDSRYEEATALSAKGVALKEFCGRLSKMADEWEDGFAQDFPEVVHPEEVAEAHRTILSSSKSSKTILVVRFPDGTVISEPKAAYTLAKAIEKIGFEEVRALEIFVNKENLVSLSKSPKYQDHNLAGYYIKTHSSTSQKKKNLEDIAKALKLDLSVQVVDP
ncbi:hypothetical protein NBRC116590_09520 [Pelagimonas sp. KU-00592-HH]|uniref:hypothetical protein n=1 Tax=Pelagimonas sp. KU-00592-HH TaxID=3127651 RepID=UPI00310BF682